MRNMPLRKMLQDFYDEFKGWYYDRKTAEAVICLESLVANFFRGIRVIDPMWLVNLLKKDVECLFFNKIWYLEENKVQAMQYQKIINVCYGKDIYSRNYWKTSWRDFERIEFLREEKRLDRIIKKIEEATFLASLKLPNRSSETDQTPIPSEEKKTVRLTKFFDASLNKKKWWLKKGRFERRENREKQRHKKRKR
ncbi:hypothetical protein Hanom_Chr16g01426241 [Helianthus anomalus]